MTAAETMMQRSNSERTSIDRSIKHSRKSFVNATSSATLQLPAAPSQLLLLQSTMQEFEPTHMIAHSTTVPRDPR
jgi:hypothetical protein